MHAYTVIMITDQRQRRRASVLASSPAQACSTGRTVALAAGYQPVSIVARPIRRAR